MNQINILNYALNSFEISENKDNKLIVDNIIGSSFLAYKIYKERNENILLLTSTNEEANKIYRAINSLINQNEIIGLSLIFSSSPYYKASFYAETLTTITLISKLDLLKMMRENDTIQKNILSLISDYSIEQSNHIRLLSYKTIRQKLCAFLYMQAKEKKATTFLINYTKTELALFLNVERPSLSKELSKLIQEGLIANQNKLYTIINEKKLSEEL